ncbi:MAG: DUF5777 family beta-barrel protein [Melioribacteraceae bacterium]|nr:DUF5777 family beta-barrel protein [Melioribacteraceae bacterium]
MIKKMLLMALLTISVVFSQVKWEREEPEENLPVELFHSTFAVNLPTAETVGKRELEIEISHRFIPTIKSGSKDFWGLDGPVVNRLALAYGITPNTQVTLGRSNAFDNYELSLKQKVFENDNDVLPFMITLNAGAAWNSDHPIIESSDSKAFQYFVQAIFNTMYDKKLAFGIVPSYLNNSHPECKENQYSFTMGTYLQYYLSEVFSLIWEYNPTVTGWRSFHNPMSFGLEIETGGHFFKIFLTNSTDLNQTQFLSGADKSFDNGDLRLGFMITRLLFL